MNNVGETIPHPLVSILPTGRPLSRLPDPARHKAGRLL